MPVSDEWTVTKAYEPVIKDGKLYGRGSADDKGPSIVALHALKAVKDLGIELSKNVRLILGTDEECGSSDIEHYYAVEKEAPMTFSPDAEFPVINIEKGRLAPEFTSDFSEDKIRDAGIDRRFENDDLDNCVRNIINYVNSVS